MKEDIFSLIDERQNVTFAELVRDVPGFNAVDLAESFELAADRPGVVYWCFMSREAVHAMLDLQAEGRIRARRCGLAPYLIDGTCLTLKIAKPGKSYKRTRWMPVTWSTR